MNFSLDQSGTNEELLPAPEAATAHPLSPKNIQRLRQENSRLPRLSSAEEELTRYRTHATGHSTYDIRHTTQDTGHRTQNTRHRTRDTRAPAATPTGLRDRVGMEGPLLPTAASLCNRIVESAKAALYTRPESPPPLSAPRHRSGRPHQLRQAAHTTKTLLEINSRILN
ncbi:hypothetical protein J6590_061507 [Homalodisca vitripennis]|nr:hypothetical protein J6590_061507 [Homalodisca vitripennis]